MVRDRTKLSAFSAATLVIGTALIALATSPPARADWTIVANPVTGNPEAVWSNTPSGQPAANILYSYLDGNNWAASTTLSEEGKVASTPVLAFDASGGRLAAWESYDTGQILMRSLPASGGSWSDTLTMSDTGETAALPSVVAHDDFTWVSYETSFVGGHTVKVAKSDSGGMVERSLVQSTSYGGPLHTRIHSDSGHLWIDWIDSSTSVGFSEYRNETWTEPAYESYDGEEDIKRARGDIQSLVVR